MPAIRRLKRTLEGTVGLNTFEIIVAGYSTEWVKRIEGYFKSLIARDEPIILRYRKSYVITLGRNVLISVFNFRSRSHHFSNLNIIRKSFWPTFDTNSEGICFQINTSSITWLDLWWCQLMSENLWSENISLKFHNILDNRESKYLIDLWLDTFYFYFEKF